MPAWVCRDCDHRNPPSRVQCRRCRTERPLGAASAATSRMAGHRFNRAEVERRLGPAAIAKARALVDAAPPLSIEQREQLRAIFASARPPRPAEGAAVKKAA